MQSTAAYWNIFIFSFFYRFISVTFALLMISVVFTMMAWKASYLPRYKHISNSPSDSEKKDNF